MAIRTNTLVEDFDVISVHDDALEKSAADFDEKWKQHRDGMGDPPFKAGEKPTRFKLRHLTSSERAYLMEIAQGDDKGLLLGAAAIALVDVNGMIDEEGRQIRVVQEVTKVGPLRIRSATKRTLDKLPIEVLLELGSLALERSAPRPS